MSIVLAAYGSGAAANPLIEPPHTDPIPAKPTLAATIQVPATQQPTLAPTANPIQLTATVWTSDPQAPVLLYHHFIPDNQASDPTHARLSDFRNQMEALYQAGYSLIPLESWLAGDLRLQPGRKPMILTIDDLFFADQVFLDASGNPSPHTGLGVLWQFSQQHPDFGFSAALFFNLGDKDYGNLQVGSSFIKGAGWQSDLARVIVWCLEHGAIPYNHFYRHPMLDNLPPEQILEQARENDLRLNDLLISAGRPDLIDRLGNVLALPYGHWPKTEPGRQAVMSYVNPQGQALQGIMEVGSSTGNLYIQPVYIPGFDLYHIPRRVGGELITKDLTAHADRVPSAQECHLPAIDALQVEDPQALAALIQGAIQSNMCPEGIYALQGLVFKAEAGDTRYIWP
jgi:hypothetical protein